MTAGSRNPLLSAAGAASALAVPVRGQERAHRVLLVAGRAPRHFEPAETHFLETVANVVATSIDAREAQEALRGRERLARAVFDHARDGMAIVDEEGRCVDVNPAAERILGVPFETLRGRRPGEVVRTDADLAARAGARLQQPAPVTTPSGTRAVEWDLVPGILPGLSLAVLRDVTERREVQARLALADRLISVGTLAAGMAHELNTPLAYVAANLEFLARAVPEHLAPGGAPEIGEALRESVDGAERLRLIIEDLRTFSRPPDGDEQGPADLDAVLRSCIGMAWNEIRHRARLQRDLPPLPAVAGNPARLGQVFVNLLVNAAQSIREGDVEANVIRVLRACAPGGRVAVEVSDTGAGIPSHVLPRIFEPFFTTKPAAAGTGLGLSICRTIVDALGGTIDVKSQPGAGSTFRVVLPVAQGPAAAPTVTPPPPPSAPLPRSRILVVDDERLVGSSLARALAGEHDVTAASSPRMALRLLEQGERFDALLTDLVMPDLTGLELVREAVRLDPALAGRVIFMTAGAFTAEARRAIRARHRAVPVEAAQPGRAPRGARAGADRARLSGARPPLTHRLGVEARPDRRDLLAERRQPPRLHRSVARDLDAERVHVAPALLHAVVEVRPRREAGRAGVADDLLLRDALPGGDRDRREVAVDGLVAVPVLQDDGLPAAAVPARLLDLPVADRPDRRADRRAVVDALVRAHVAEERVDPVAEARGDVRVLERRLEEAAPRALAVVVEVAGLPVGIRVAEQPLPARRRAAVVLGREDLAVAQQLAVGEDLLDHHPHPVAGADVLVEVDVPGQHVGRRAPRAPGPRRPSRATPRASPRSSTATRATSVVSSTGRLCPRSVPSGQPLHDPLVRGALPVAEPVELGVALAPLDAGAGRRGGPGGTGRGPSARPPPR